MRLRKRSWPAVSHSCNLICGWEKIKKAKLPLKIKRVKNCHLLEKLKKNINSCRRWLGTGSSSELSFPSWQSLPSTCGSQAGVCAPISALSAVLSLQKCFPSRRECSAGGIMPYFEGKSHQLLSEHWRSYWCECFRRDKTLVIAVSVFTL